MVWRVQDRRRGRGNDNPLDGGRVGMDRLENAGGALDSRVQAVLDRVFPMQLVGGRRVDDVVERGV